MIACASISDSFTDEQCQIFFVELPSTKSINRISSVAQTKSHAIACEEYRKYSAPVQHLEEMTLSLDVEWRSIFCQSIFLQA